MLLGLSSVISVNCNPSFGYLKIRIFYEIISLAKSFSNHCKRFKYKIKFAKWLRGKYSKARIMWKKSTKPHFKKYIHFFSFLPYKIFSAKTKLRSNETWNQTKKIYIAKYCYQISNITIFSGTHYFKNSMTASLIKLEQFVLFLKLQSLWWLRHEIVFLDSSWSLH